jgi:hypothetical protein
MNNLTPLQEVAVQIYCAKILPNPRNLQQPTSNL